MRKITILLFALLFAVVVAGCSTGKAAPETKEIESKQEVKVEKEDLEKEKQKEEEKQKEIEAKEKEAEEKAEKKKAEEKKAKEKAEKEKAEKEAKEKAEKKKAEEKKAAEAKKAAETKEKSQSKPKKKTKQVKHESASGDYMSTSVINVYNSAGGPSVGKLNPYQKIVATKKASVNSENWFQVKFKNQTFWVKEKQVSKYKKQSQPKSTANSGSSKSTSSNGYQPNRIYYAGKSVHYQNAGRAGTTNGNGTTGNAQRVIDTTSSASTYGGTATFSGTDGKNTHFIGHNGKQFIGMQNASVFVVTDSSGRAFEYKRTAKHLIDEYGNRIDNGQSIYDRIVGTGGGERIVLQTTEVHPRKWIIEAEFSREIK